MEVINLTPRRVAVTVMLGYTRVAFVAAPAQRDQSVLPGPGDERVYLADAWHPALQANPSIPTGRRDLVMVSGGPVLVENQTTVEASPVFTQ